MWELLLSCSETAIHVSYASTYFPKNLFSTTLLTWISSHNLLNNFLKTNTLVPLRVSLLLNFNSLPPDQISWLGARDALVIFAPRVPLYVKFAISFPRTVQEPAEVTEPSFTGTWIQYTPVSKTARSRWDLLQKGNINPTGTNDSRKLVMLWLELCPGSRYPKLGLGIPQCQRNSIYALIVANEWPFHWTCVSRSRNINLHRGSQPQSLPPTMSVKI